MPYGKSPKSEISKAFVKLKQFGYSVLNFNSNRKFGSNMAGFVDSVIFNKKYFIAIEVKTTETKDKKSDEQKDTAEKLSSIMAINKTFYYFIVKNLNDAKGLVDKILSNKL
jgi:Holliday junction resolvase-like predicted endonuclease